MRSILFVLFLVACSSDDKPQLVTASVRLGDCHDGRMETLSITAVEPVIVSAVSAPATVRRGQYIRLERPQPSLDEPTVTGDSWYYAYYSGDSMTPGELRNFVKLSAGESFDFHRVAYAESECMPSLAVTDFTYWTEDGNRFFVYQF